MTNKTKNLRTDVFKYVDMHEGDRAVCWEWQRPISNTSMRPYFSVEGKRISSYRLVYELTFGVTLTPQVLLRHKCDNQICCNPYHVEEGTHAENMDDMKKRERHGLPHHTVRAIRALYKEGATSQELIARRFGIARETVSGITTGRYYKHVEEGEDGNE